MAGLRTWTLELGQAEIEEKSPAEKLHGLEPVQGVGLQSIGYPRGRSLNIEEKKSLGLTKDRKSTLSTDAGKAVEKGTCDQFVLLSKRSIACHVVPVKEGKKEQAQQKVNSDLVFHARGVRREKEPSWWYLGNGFNGERGVGKRKGRAYVAPDIVIQYNSIQCSYVERQKGV